MPSYYPLFNPDPFAKIFSRQIAFSVMNPPFLSDNLLCYGTNTRPSTPIPSDECLPYLPPPLVRQDAVYNIWSSLWDEVNDEIVVHSITVDNYNQQLTLENVSPFYYDSMKLKFLPSTIVKITNVYHDMKEYSRNPLPHLLQRIKLALTQPTIYAYTNQIKSIIDTHWIITFTDTQDRFSCPSFQHLIEWMQTDPEVSKHPFIVTPPQKPLIGIETNPGPPPPSPYLVQAICDGIVKVVDELVDACAPASFFPPDAVVPSDEVFLAQWLCSS